MATRRAAPSRKSGKARKPRAASPVARALAEKNTVVAVVLGEGPDADAAETLAREVAENGIFSQVRVVRSTELPAAVALPAGSGTPRTVILRFDRGVSAALDDRAAKRVSDLSDALLFALAGR
jgi:hypothetical protein